MAKALTLQSAQQHAWSEACSHSRACWWGELTQVYEPGSAEAGPSTWDGQDPSLGSSWGGLQPGFPTSVQGRKDNVTGTSARGSTLLKTESWRHLQKVTRLSLAAWVTSDTTPALFNLRANTLGSKHQPPLSTPEIKPQPIFLEIRASLPLAGVMVVNGRSCVVRPRLEEVGCRRCQSQPRLGECLQGDCPWPSPRCRTVTPQLGPSVKQQLLDVQSLFAYSWTLRDRFGDLKIPQSQLEMSVKTPELGLSFKERINSPCKIPQTKCITSRSLPVGRGRSLLITAASGNQDWPSGSKRLVQEFKITALRGARQRLGEWQICGSKRWEQFEKILVNWRKKGDPCLLLPTAK